MIRVTVWNEYFKPQDREPYESETYPEGMHAVIANFLQANDSEIAVTTRTMHDAEFGLDEETLKNTDVLVYWSHIVQHAIPDEIVRRAADHVLSGMGLIVLHSGHASKLFKTLMGTNTNRLRWHEEGFLLRVWKIDYAHPIAEGLPDYFDLEHEETYGEHFDIPQPDDLVFVSWASSGEVFRSGCCWNRGLGRVFYFQPGHETFGSFYDQNVQKVVLNAVRWAYRPHNGTYTFVTDKTEPIV